MYSIGDLVDKLVIENLKIFTVRDLLHSEELSDKEYVELNNKMNILNQNRSILANLLDDKVEKVVSKKEKNVLLKIVKTYNTEDEVQ
jgi:hypothetical protein|tara:strand:+ start:2773 stop:3033 length:261 start_codon:yes stop_codon:yes gene_type:complete